MKRSIVFLCLLVGGLCLGETDFPLQFNGQLARQDFAGMETTLRDWRHSNPDDAGWLVAQGEYFYAKAQKDAPALSRAGAAETPVVWCPTPQPSSEPPARNPAYFDRPLMSQAVTCWKRALFSSPWRVDLYFKLSRLFQDLGDFQSQYDTLANGLQYIDKNHRSLKWVNPNLLPFAAAIPPLLQEPIAYYLAQDQPEAWDKAHRLIRLAVTFYPDYPYFYNSLAAFYSTRGDWAHTFKYLLIASQKDPKESLYVFNMGNTLAGMGRPREARIFYRQVVKMNQRPEYVEVAENFLKTSSQAGH